MTPTDEQKHIGQLVVAGKNVKVIAGAGAGKAQPLDEPVLTPTGWKLLGELTTTDLVISEQGTPIKIADIIDHNALEMYTVNFSDGSSTNCCEDHLWEVQTPSMRENTGNSAGNSKVMPLKEMFPKIRRDAAKSKKSNYHYSVLLTKPVIFPPQTYHLAPYSLGYVLGNGSSNGNYLRLAVWDKDVKEIQSYFQPSEILSENDTPNSNVTYFSLSYNCRKYYKIALQLLNIKSGTKYIPENYLLGSVEQRKELLAGLLDSDGSCVKNRASFSSTSLSLADNVVQLVRSLGGVAKIGKPDTRNTATCYAVQIRTPFNPFKLARKAAGYVVRPLDITANKRITSVEYIGKMPGRCISVASERQLYITRDYTVTHNSSTLRYIAQQVPARNILVLTFNKANATETMEHVDRPDNLFACTIHSLAYRAVIDKFYKKKLSNWLDYNDIAPDTIKQVIWKIGVAPADEKKALILLRRSILDTVKLFCQSGQKDVGTFAESYLTWTFVTNTDELFKAPLLISTIKSLVGIVDTYWMDLLESPTAKINPDVYLKLFHLLGHSIKEVWSVDLKRYVTVQAVALDEFQDSNEVTKAIFANQGHLQRIIVGDPNQQLYRWRGASGTMEEFPDFSVGYLSTSFRFNNEIARMANIVLERNDSPFQLTGSSTRTDIETRAILCRTNATVLETFFTMVTEGFTGKIGISTDIKTTFSKMYHLESCWFDRAPKYPVAELSSITDKRSMIEALEYSDELQRINNLSQKLSKGAGSLFKAQEMLKKHIAGADDFPLLTISTVHGFKGREASHVTIADDFINIKEDADVTEQVERMWDNVDMRCSLYVGLTRARVEVVLPWYLEDSFK